MRRETYRCDIYILSQKTDLSVSKAVLTSNNVIVRGLANATKKKRNKRSKDIDEDTKRATH